MAVMSKESYNSDYRPSDDLPVDDVTGGITNSTDNSAGISTPAVTTPATPAGVDEESPAAASRKVQRSNAGTMWTSLIVGAFLLVILLVFILQNQEPANLKFFGWEAEFPTGVGMLIAAIIGALIMAAVGGTRIIQLRRQVVKS